VGRRANGWGGKEGLWLNDIKSLGKFPKGEKGGGGKKKKNGGKKKKDCPNPPELRNTWKEKEYLDKGREKTGGGT